MEYYYFSSAANSVKGVGTMSPIKKQNTGPGTHVTFGFSALLINLQGLLTGAIR